MLKGLVVIITGEVSNVLTTVLTPHSTAVASVGDVSFCECLTVFCILS